MASSPRSARDPMNPLPASPAHTHAVIIGIEKYAAGPAWKLNGPVNDALSIRSWMVSQAVPESQLHLHLSALDENQDSLQTLQGGHAPATNEALRHTFDALRAIPHSQADLLIVYWAGHGLISRDRHCVMLPEATDTDMACYSVENLRSSLSSSSCAGFPQQIFLLDTCQSFHRHHAEPPPALDLPVGEPERRNQFIFYAGQPGQAAMNLGEEQCGLFSKILLEQLRESPHSSSMWPPNMEAISKSVQTRFQELRSTQTSVAQYPIYSMTVDWEGNSRSDPFPTAYSHAPEDVVNLLDALEQLAKLLALHLGRSDQRDRLINDFRNCGVIGQEIYMNVNRRNDALGDYNEIIDACRDYSEGLEMLKRISLHTLGGRSAARKVEAAFWRLEKAEANDNMS